MQAVLDKIYAQRRKDVEVTRKLVPEEQLKAWDTSFKPINFYERLTRLAEGQNVALIAEVKRASPSRGDIAPFADPVQQGLKYASGGCNGISVLTEPGWFKGQMADVMALRLALDAYYPNGNRPAILRKEFIFDRYQVLEARYYGADSLLLIVKMLTDEQLVDLIAYSRELNLEPLVEVNNEEEMERAKKAGAKIIGVNNRNLQNQEIDLNTTTQVAKSAPDGVILAALSGIWSREDVQLYEKQNVKALLVGESLMRSEDPSEFIADLLGCSSASIANPNKYTQRTIVKTCGIRTVEDAVHSAKTGADFIGMIMVPGTKRTINNDTAKGIVDAVRFATGHSSISSISSPLSSSSASSVHLFESLMAIRKPVMVGVFRDQSAPEILAIAREVGLDAIQLHDTDINEAKINELSGHYPLMHVVHVENGNASEGTTHLERLQNKVQFLESKKVFPLLDTQSKDGTSGGAGVSFDWSLAAKLREKNHSFFMAGGLNPDNVVQAIKEGNAWGVDVSSGTETNQKKDPAKIDLFIKLCQQ